MSLQGRGWKTVARAGNPSQRPGLPVQPCSPFHLYEKPSHRRNHFLSVALALGTRAEPLEPESWRLKSGAAAVTCSTAKHSENKHTFFPSFFLSFRFSLHSASLSHFFLLSLSSRWESGRAITPSLCPLSTSVCRPGSAPERSAGASSGTIAL